MICFIICIPPSKALIDHRQVFLGLEGTDFPKESLKCWEPYQAFEEEMHIIKAGCREACYPV